MMLINPADIAYFLEITQTLNISRAAERLGVGQPALSQAMHRLESHFGVPLLDRFKTGVRLTAAGRRLQTQGRAMLESFAKLKEDVTAAEARIEGQYSIGCHPAVALYSLPRFMRQLLGAHPGLSIRLAHGLSREIAEAVVSFKVDFGIVVNPTQHPDLVIRELCRDQIGFWSAPSGLTDTLIFDPALHQSQVLVGKSKTLFARHLESSSLEVIGELTQSGCGVGILPARVAQRFRKLRPFRQELPRFEDQICLIYRADRRLSGAARLILDTIRASEI